MAQLTVADVATRLGVAESTIRAYSARGQMPAPDGHLGRTPWWGERTITDWIKQREGRAMKTTIESRRGQRRWGVKSTVLEGTDARGRTWAARIEWMPESASVDAGLDNVGKTLVAWVDECPARFESDGTGGLRLVADPVQVTGCGSQSVLQPVRWPDGDTDRLEVGCWRVVEWLARP